MNITKTTNITINNPCGMPLGTPIAGFGIGGMCGPSVFGFGYYSGCMPANNSVAAGMCTGLAASALIRNPEAAKALGKVIAFPFKMAYEGGKWLWNHALKPAGKAIGQAAGWVWNHTIGALFSKKSDKA